MDQLSTYKRSSLRYAWNEGLSRASSCQSPVIPGFTSWRRSKFRVESVYFVGNGRTGSNQAHRSHKDVKELREFINAQRPHNCPHPRHSWIVCRLEKWAVSPFVDRFEVVPVFRIGRHRAQLVDLEGSTPEADPRLAVEGRTMVLKANRYSGQEDEGRSDEQPTGCSYYIENPLAYELPFSGVVPAQRRETVRRSPETSGLGVIGVPGSRARPAHGGPVPHRFQWHRELLTQ